MIGGAIFQAQQHHEGGQCLPPHFFLSKALLLRLLSSLIAVQLSWVLIDMSRDAVQAYDARNRRAEQRVTKPLSPLSPVVGRRETPNYNI